MVSQHHLWYPPVQACRCIHLSLYMVVYRYPCMGYHTHTLYGMSHTYTHIHIPLYQGMDRCMVTSYMVSLVRSLARCHLDPATVSWLRSWSPGGSPDPHHMQYTPSAPPVSLLYALVGIHQETGRIHIVYSSCHRSPDTVSDWEPSDWRYHLTSRSGVWFCGLQTVAH